MVKDSGTEPGRPTTYAELADVIDNMALICREARRARGISARTMAEQAGVSASTFTRLDQGHTLSSDGLIAVLRWLDQTAVAS